MKICPYIFTSIAAIFMGILSFKECISGQDPEYVGLKRCKGCHIIQYRTWQKGGHSRAFLHLKGEERKDPRCLVCHTTGYGRPGSDGADLRNVQCEACHGPGSIYRSPIIMNKSRYLKDPHGMHRRAMEAGLKEPEERVCIECHNQRCPNFREFHIKEALKKIRH